MKVIKKPHLLLFLFIVGCQTVVDADLPEQKARMVASSFLAPDSTIWVKLENSKPALSTRERTVIPDAQLSLVDEQGTGHALQYTVRKDTHRNGYLTTQSFYTTDDLAIQPNTQYKLRGEHDSYPSIRSEITIPTDDFDQSVKLLDHRRKETEYGNRYMELDLELEIKDPESEQNYYAIYLNQRSNTVYSYSDTTIFDTRDDNMGFETADPAVYQEYYELSNVMDNNGHLFFGEPMYISDEQFNGEDKAFILTTELDIPTRSFVKIIDFSIDIHVMKVTKGMYLYAKSVRKAQYNDEMIPIGEPARVYNNIENGFGIFGGYTALMDSLVLIDNYKWEL
ncbi:MAG: DUF4249 domain-containing protein [Bacteroidota bacterium]